MDLLRYQRYVERSISCIISEQNKSIILKHQEYLRGEHYSLNTMNAYLKTLKKLALFLGDKPFYKVSEEEIKACLNQPVRDRTTNEIRDMEPSTYNYYLSRIKSFLKWLNGGDEYPDCVKRIKWRKVKKLTPYTANDIWTEDDILLLVKNVDHTRDKALLATLFDFAGRPHECLALRVGDIRFEDRYAEAVIPDRTKTGQRAIPLLLSFPYLRDWINVHPFKDNPNSPLWIRLKGFPKAIDYYGLRGLLRKMQKRLAGKINKPFNPYLFRHSRLTKMATILTESQLNSFAGWVQGSRMPARYVHLSMRDIKPALLQHYGLQTREEVNKPSPLAPKICPRCSEANSPDAKFCRKCSLALTIEAWEEEKKKQVDINKLAKKIEALEKMFPSLNDGTER